MGIKKQLKDPKYTEAYSEVKLFDKIKEFAKAAGIDLIYIVLLLFYSMKQPSTPGWAKATIIGALGYFINPADAIPDAIPGIGQADDMAVLLAALAMVAFYIDEDTKKNAKAKLQSWFGNYDEAKLDTIDKKVEAKRESSE